MKPFLVVLVPDRHVGPEVIAARYGWPLLGVIACACVAAFALGSRLDLGPTVRAENSGAPPAATATTTTTQQASPKPPDLKTDREIDEEIAQRTAVTRVQLGFGALVATPFRVLMLALALLLLGRFIGGKPTMPRVLAVAALASVPGAVRSLVTALAAWRQPSLGPGDLDSLVQSPSLVPDGHPILERFLTGVDVFTVWSVVILAFGLCAAADLRRTKGFTAIVIGFVLYLAVTRLIMGAGR